MFGKKKKPPQPKPAQPDQSPAKDQKKTILLGLGMIVLSFAGAVFVMVSLTNAYRGKMTDMATLKVKINAMRSEQDVAEVKIISLEEELAATPDLETIVREAQDVYGEEEGQRQEGYLWIDRDGRSWVVTLGVLNGLDQDSRLAVYDQEQRVGEVEVDIPLDVISYVLPVGKNIQNLDKDYYRVVLER